VRRPHVGSDDELATSIVGPAMACSCTTSVLKRIHHASIIIKVNCLKFDRTYRRITKTSTLGLAKIVLLLKYGYFNLIKLFHQKNLINSIMI